VRTQTRTRAVNRLTGLPYVSLLRGGFDYGFRRRGWSRVLTSLIAGAIAGRGIGTCHGTCKRWHTLPSLHIAAIAVGAYSLVSTNDLEAPPRRNDGLSASGSQKATTPAPVGTRRNRKSCVLSLGPTFASTNTARPVSASIDGIRPASRQPLDETPARDHSNHMGKPGSKYAGAA
jgi:hypothetical protein